MLQCVHCIGLLDRQSNLPTGSLIDVACQYASAWWSARPIELSIASVDT